MTVFDYNANHECSPTPTKIVGVSFDWKDSPEMVVEEINEALLKKGVNLRLHRMDDGLSDGSEYILLIEDDPVPTEADWNDDEIDENI